MKIEDYKAGIYHQQYEYQSFSPENINHSWEFSDSEIQSLLSKADRSLGELNAFSQLIPNVDFFIRMHIAKEATSSSRIEGTRTNIEDALMGKDDIAPEQRDDWMEVQNYITAIKTAIEKLETLPLSNRLLKHTHHVLMSGVRGQNKQPGEFRISQNWIGVNLKHAVFVPPHHEEVPDLMADLESFMQNQQELAPHLIKIAIAHYQFETIHPFLDGNGRLGRLMIALYLANFDLLAKPSLYLSDYFERHKTEYVDALMAVRENSKIKPWLIFFLNGVLETAQNSIVVFKNILELKGSIDAEILPRFSTRRQENAQNLMRLLYQFPVLDIKTISNYMNMPTNTAAALVSDFVKYGVLEEITGKRRNRLYSFKRYISIFSVVGI